ncbi:MAG TPA: large conductance mechanosensitive channel protein MscL [Acidimicrobiia bacterium]|nr:large conductance mechanosensitive channel protein MscL [Acidimicrobiia bacterium]
MIEEFRAFALKGNLLDIAVGFVLGIAFAAVIGSLVADIITPLIAAIFGQPDFGTLSITINESRILYGSFLNAVFTFLVVALALFFFIVKPYNLMRARSERGQEDAVEEPAEDIVLLTQIRDALRRG